MNKEIFPGNTFVEKIKNEILDLTVKAEYRTQFWIMVGYSSILFLVTIVSFYKNLLPGNDIRAIYILLLLGLYWFISDFTKRKNLFTKNIRFILDSFVYVFLMYKIVMITGADKSPIRFPLFFLTAISAPLYGSLVGVFILLSVVAGIQIYLCIGQHGVSYQSMFTILEAISFIAAAMFIKESMITIQKKIEAEDLLNMELASKLEETTVAMKNIKAKNDELAKLTKELAKHKKLKK